MSEQKQEIKKQEPKVEVIQPMLCPFISGFLIEPVKTPLGQMNVAKTTNVAPCMENKCKFYNEDKKDCKINLFLEGK